jgi:hypothetical protein
MNEAYGRACQETARLIGNELSRKQNQIDQTQAKNDLLEKDKIATGLKTQDFKDVVAKLNHEKRQLVDHVSEISNVSIINEQRNEESRAANEELGNRVAVLESSAVVTLLLVQEQSQTIADLQCQLVAQGRIIIVARSGNTLNEDHDEYGEFAEGESDDGAFVQVSTFSMSFDEIPADEHGGASFELPSLDIQLES